MQIYKLLGKKVIMHFVGADIRSEKYLDWKSSNMISYLKGDKNPFPLTEVYQDTLIKDTRRYADHILVSTPDLLEIIPEAIYYPVVLDFKDIPQKIEKEDKISILFSPSSHKTKGTQYIHDVIDKIAKKYEDKVKIVLPGKNLKQNSFYALTRYDLLEQFTKTHIVIDQMLIGWYGLKSVEALYYDCDVICYIEENCEKYLFEKNPIINSNVINLQEKIEELIESKLMNSENQKNRKWVLEHHSILNNHETLLKCWNFDKIKIITK
jgi:hypothetical protein